MSAMAPSSAWSLLDADERAGPETRLVWLSEWAGVFSPYFHVRGSLGCVTGIEKGRSYV